MSPPDAKRIRDNVVCNNTSVFAPSFPPSFTVMSHTPTFIAPRFRVRDDSNPRRQKEN